MAQPSFHVGDRVLVNFSAAKHGHPAKVVGFRDGMVRVMLYVSGCEIHVDPATISKERAPRA